MGFINVCYINSKTTPRLYDWGRYDDAKVWVGSLLEQEPDNGEALALLGNILKQQGKVYEARSIFEKAMITEPLNPEVWFQAALFYHDIKDYIESDKCFLEALKYAPEDMQILEEQKRCMGERA